MMIIASVELCGLHWLRLRRTSNTYDRFIVITISFILCGCGLLHYMTMIIIIIVVFTIRFIIQL